MKFNIIHEEGYTVTPSDIQIIEESTFGLDPKIKFKCKLQERDVVNNNNRTYTGPVLSEIVNQLRPKATSRKLIGELDHPSPQGGDAARLKRSSTIALQDSCILYSDIEYDGQFIVATAETLTNSKGMDLYRLLKDKVTIGFSLRAFGGSTVGPTGIVSVNLDGLKALTFDVVSNPSHDNAVIYEFLNESTDPLILIKELQSHKKEIVEIITESSDIQSMVQFNLDGNQVCSCEIDGSCVEGTIEESVDYLINIALTKNSIKNFNFRLI